MQKTLQLFFVHFIYRQFCTAVFRPGFFALIFPTLLARVCEKVNWAFCLTVLKPPGGTGETGLVQIRQAGTDNLWSKWDKIQSKNSDRFLTKFWFFFDKILKILTGFFCQISYNFLSKFWQFLDKIATVFSTAFLFCQLFFLIFHKSLFWHNFVRIKPPQNLLVSPFILVTLHFVPFHFVPRSLCPGRFIPWSLCLWSLCPRSLCPRSLFPLVNLSPGHFVPQSLCPRSLCPLGIFSPGHFVPCHFVPSRFVPYIRFLEWHDMKINIFYSNFWAVKTGLNNILRIRQPFSAWN
jgi:hypothetical protein